MRAEAPKRHATISPAESLVRESAGKFGRPEALPLVWELVGCGKVVGVSAVGLEGSDRAVGSGASLLRTIR